MLNNILKVYGEDLINGSIADSTVASSQVVAAGYTEGALCVNVFAETDVATLEDVDITVKDGDSEGGSFSELLTITIPENKSFAKGALIDTVMLPQNTKAFVMATATSDATNTGKIRVTLGYLAR